MIALVTVRAAVLRFDVDPFCSSRHFLVESCPVWLPFWVVVRKWHLHQTTAGSTLHGRKVAIFLVLELSQPLRLRVCKNKEKTMHKNMF